MFLLFNQNVHTRLSICPVKNVGCYECSQRRIHCDRVQPCCGKCASRGIPCSGLGVRYRFRDGGSQGNGRVISRSINAHRPLSVVALPGSNSTGSEMSQMTPQNPMH
ncbi:hypothetical protein BDV30DRAFT_149298 [Aspergillus minisclerotigenes]|uniref:Zn(2)-C6 fungal-type domain-containing protein n=1 Tax=Aspergillus minisclerotigenes TaxID=656917 RepID=A0A5N6IY63_9EURO|nr:hypothetical protein BDV30DRAFT_149298 [Aspergillus minisclerotigenes]